MERIHIAFAMLALLLFSFGCTSLVSDTESLVGGDGRTAYYDGGTSGEMAKASPGASDASVQDAMVIKTGSAQIEVPENALAQRYTALKAMAAQYNGEVSYSSYYESESGKTQYVTVKIDSNKFDEFTGRLSELGTVKSLSSNTDDVTQEYIDTTAKLSNLVASRDRLLALYNRTANLSEIIMLEQAIENVQYQIDYTTQQKLYYERQSAKASVSITMTEPLPVVDTTILDPLSQLANMFIGSLIVGVTLVVVGAGFVIPLAIAALVLWKIAAWLWSKMKKK